MDSIELSQRLIADARYPAGFVLQHGLAWPDPPAERKAKQVLAELAELALAPLAASAPSADMDHELWALRTMAHEMIEFRQRAAQVLQDLLSNRNRASRQWEGLPPFPHPPGARVCDLAFLLLHRLLRLPCSPSAFYRLPPEDRDRRIRTLPESRAFRSALKEPS
ncbi:MAG TPA: hypothetical protein VMH28_11590 [Candidatus Acidoferrales bacterium]|nr:hypothetical protein [Candidatus Acidoferrales bacterium]